MKAIFAFFLSFLIALPPAAAIEDPTGGKPFLPWLWEEQFWPTIESAAQPSSLYLLGAGAGATVLSHQYDHEVRERYRDNQKLSQSASAFGGQLGSGVFSIGLAVGQLFFDQKNGLLHGRAIALTSLTHITIALSARRERPNGNAKISFPSGHTSSMFATATALSYSYGAWVGMPAYAAAVFVGAARISDDQHWLSDTVAGAAIGIFWARNSALADSDRLWAIEPIPVPGGAVLSMSREF